MWVRGLKRFIFVQFIRFLNVASHVGAWIETRQTFRSLQGRQVASHVGAWIETSIDYILSHISAVASHVGAWIETLLKRAGADK